MLIFIEWFNEVWKRRPNEIEAELGKPVPQHERIVALVGQMAAALDHFEALLAGRAHLMSEDFSAADCAAFPNLKYALFRDPADDELFHRILDEHQQLGETHPDSPTGFAESTSFRELDASPTGRAFDEG